MKTQDIHLLKVYANADTPPLFRRVVDQGAHLRAYQDQMDLDCVAYEEFRWHSRSWKYRKMPKQRRCTRASFASWAKREASEEESVLPPF